MADFKQIYFHIARATEEAISILIQAQQECEELYLAAEATVFPIQVMEQRKRVEPPIKQP